MRIFRPFVTAILGIVASTAHGQTEPAFEVASVKLTSHGRDASGLSHSDIDIAGPGRLVATNASMRECIQFAWNLQDFEIAGPSWLNSDAASYDIEAKAPPETTEGQMRLMLRALLRERFRLVVHQESRMSSVYLLTVAKSGLKLAPAKADAKPGFSNSSALVTRIVSEKATLRRLARGLSGRMGRPVIDQTGLEGYFAIDLEWQNDEIGSAALSALQAKGLKLEAAKAPIEVVVVDITEKVPSAN